MQIVESNANDIVYSSLFTGIHGSYLKGSITNAGLDPDSLNDGNKNKMDFGSENTKSKAWKDIWGAGQGVGSMKHVLSVSALVEQLYNEYSSTKSRILD